MYDVKAYVFVNCFSCLILTNNTYKLKLHKSWSIGHCILSWEHKPRSYVKYSKICHKTPEIGRKKIKFYGHLGSLTKIHRCYFGCDFI
jgi:hypothetical protein